MTARIPNENDFESIHLYKNIMEEIKFRIAAINTLLSNQAQLPGPIVQESLYLQLRLICELVALGCLIAHGDIEASQEKRYRTEWSAEKMLKGLEALHPDFYPIPSRITGSGEEIKLELLKEGHFLKKQELLSLYRKTGTYLHRGTLKKWLSQRTPLQTNFPDIVDFTQKIETLLHVHTISRLSGNPIVCVLRNADDEGNVQVVLTSPHKPSTQ